mmetsp:Transcript_8521/g.15757  ORF Transcript_8521/g.15757 Transcript_8521/m.15757 type:complete len:204 (-) Transcript_8521:41-652(-)
MRRLASARASSVCGRWRFISSPSKSALYGLQQHSLNRNVLQGITLALCAIIDTLWRDGCLLNNTTSPSWRCLSTISPNSRFSAMRLRFAYLSSIRAPFDFSCTIFAPGCLFGPFLTAFLRRFMLCFVTRSGYVQIIAHSTGTPTSSTERFGSGEITVREEKSTRLPLRFPRKRPCLPLSLCTRARIGFDSLSFGSPGVSELTY